MAEDEEFERWKICHQVNLKFHVRPEYSASYRCPWCKEYKPEERKLTSDFSLKASHCLARHAPTSFHNMSVCAECDVDLVQRITERQVECSKKACRRKVLVDKWKVRQRIGDNDLLVKYFALVDKYRFITCSVCFDDMPIDEMVSETATPRCEHDPSMCKECLSFYVKDAIESGNWMSIKCPEPLCKEELRGHDVRQQVSIDLFKVYDDHVTRANLAKNPHFRWCISKCGNGQIVNGVPSMPALEEVASSSAKAPPLSKLKQAQWRCSKCKKLNCYRCKDEAHPEVTCEQEQRLKPQRGDNERERRRVSKKCPKRGCGRLISKQWGCVHIFCNAGSGGCGIKFCWKCKVIFKKTDNTGSSYHSWEYKHLAKCPMLGGKYETSGTVPRPTQFDTSYALDWDKDPYYEEGDSGSEQWR